MSATERPARAIWFDLESGTERVLDTGETLPGPDPHGFLWVDVELPAPTALASLIEDGVVPASVLGDEAPAGDVSWSIERDHVHLSLAGARLHDQTLRLDRRSIVITDRAVTSLHRGLPRYVEDLRPRYRDDFGRYARSRGFLIFEMSGQLVDDLQSAVRALGDRIDQLRVDAVRAPGPLEADCGAELLSSVLLMRRILVRTRDVLAELSSRRSAFIPETTQPYLGDMANRLDGLLTDLAFSRDVLSEALRDVARANAPGEVPPASAEAAPPRPTAVPGRAALRVRSLGGFEVRRGDEPIPYSAFGREPARELLAALLCARGPVPRDQLSRWFWPDHEGERARRALRVALSGLRRALEPGVAHGRFTVVVSEGDAYRVVMGAADIWDVDELLGAAERATATLEPERRVELLTHALDLYRGPLCPEWPYAEWSRALREECERARVTVRAALADAMLQTGRPREGIAHFEALLADDPERESWHRGLMRCHYEAGERALALRQFHTCRSVLRQSRGVEPSPETRSLYLQLLNRS